MTTIMIIDDEPLIRRGLESMIPWETLNCRLLDQAPNGEEGLEKILRQKPDIVFTDVKMPKMDGLTMIQEVLKEPLPPLFIILSGHNDFELVRTAMRLGAMDYLMKLNLEEPELTRVITEAKKRLAQRSTDRHADPSLLRESGDNQLKEGACYRLICLKRQEAAENCRPSGDWTQNFLINICKEHRPPHSELHVYQMTDTAAVFYMESQGDLPDSILSEKSLLMIADIKRYLNQDVSIGISPRHSSILHLGQAREEAMKSLAFSTGSMDSSVHFYTDSLNEDSLICQIAQLCPDADFFDAAENLLLQIQTFMAQHPSLPICRKICLQLITKIYEADSRSKDFFVRWCQRDYKSIQDFSDFNHVDTVVTWLLHLGCGINQYSQQYMNEIYRYKVKKAKEYIDEHRYEKISLNDVAAQLEITPSYLSKIFKKVTQQSFSDCVAEVKMEEAKILLLKDNNRIYEVSSKLGYDDPYYFSKVFKRVTQSTPSEYIARH